MGPACQPRHVPVRVTGYLRPGPAQARQSADPRQTTADDLRAVHDDIKPLVAKGLRFTGNEYLQDFASKKVWAAFVWSGDLASSGGEDDEFVVPDEGTMIWTDNMLIPKGATNKYTAELMMN